jgi:hypothetical protein
VPIELVAKKAEPAEPSVALDLIAKKPASSRPPLASEQPLLATAKPRSASDLRDSEDAADRRLREFERAAGPEDEEPSSQAPTSQRRSGVGWWVLLVILIGCAVSAYVFRDRLLPLWQSVMTDVAKRVR